MLNKVLYIISTNNQDGHHISQYISGITFWINFKPGKPGEPLVTIASVPTIQFQFQNDKLYFKSKKKYVFKYQGLR